VDEGASLILNSAGSKAFFSEEKKQKTFISQPAPIFPANAKTPVQPQDIKVFWLFSSEKNILS
jgi:hypothetical protein